MPIPTDPLLNLQWHLRNTTAGLLDLNVFGVWDPASGPAYTGLGTRTLVIDDGVDFTHADINPNYNQGLDFDFETNTLSAFGNASNAHGTAVAGIIGAAANGTGVVGVAHQTQLVGYRVYQFISDAWLQDIRDAIHHSAVSAQGDVANISQGIANDLNSEFGLGYSAVRFDEIESSINTAVDSGRGGLGMTIVKSAGNSRGDSYDVNADDWTNDTRQVVVGAVDQNGFVSSYSSYGSALLTSAFGTPGQVWTTDRVGAAGYNSGDFTASFNGTSAAAPMVAGVVALMYDANTGLGWRDVQSILGVASRQVGSEVGAGIAGSERYAWTWNHANTWNGGGQHYSNDYGYGLIDALAAVRLAESWSLTGTPAATSGNEFTNTMDVLNSAVVVPDGNLAGLSFAGNAAFDDIVERVTVQMTFSTTYVGDLEIFLTSPDGTVSRLLDNVTNDGNFNGTWTFESQAFRGERAAGTWTVRVVDSLGGDTLVVSDVVIRTWGAFTSDDRYVFTNEYSDYDGVAGHLTNIIDTNGGADTVNASAVTTSSVIRLDGLVGSIDGVGVRFTSIENAIGGDGNDSIIGNGLANKLFGMRGNDVLLGAAGADILQGLWGNDTLNGGSDSDNVQGGDGNDTVIDDDFVNFDVHDGGAGIDLIDYSGVTFANGVVTINLGAGQTSVSGGNTETITNFENAYGSQGGERIIGTSGGNVLRGMGGDDTMTGGGSADFVDGGTGNDTVLDDDFVNFDVYIGGVGIDTINYSAITFASGIVTIDLGAQQVSVSGGNTESIQGFENAMGSQGGETIRGSGGVNYLHGAGGNDTVLGLGGNDALFGNAGVDTVDGGAGSDSVNDDDAVNFDLYNGGAGIDRISYWANTFAAGIVTIDLGAQLVSVAGGNTETILNFENADGSQGGETIIGSGAANVLRGYGGNDKIYGLAGADRLLGGVGADWLFGGANSDVFEFDFASESPNSAGCDSIRTDDPNAAFLNPGGGIGDLIDLLTIDANEVLGGNQAFAFNATQAIGTLQCVNSGSTTRILGYTNALAGADFRIDILDAGVLANQYTAADFLL